ncbi:hypothetical protein IMSHALPRED_005224 [Imshaugia aleurites]|uniref:Uncharacterized protein n=1 Tax=Imshaugia aleurites TaxID=172621 RepID=A0A8H3FDH9_9LECA|nr:hypothetical protein IMSHALPRED_005224 [Imshaugia aleurites]
MATPNSHNTDAKLNTSHVNPFLTPSNDTQEPESSKASVPPSNATLIDPLPPAPAGNVDPAAVQMTPNESLSAPPPLPAQGPGLRRGLQIPSRIGAITWGFKLPEVLAEQGVTKRQWKVFSRELRAFASMSMLQWMGIIALHVTTSPSFGYRMHKQSEHKNFHLAYQDGSIKTFEDRWNNDYFHELGLEVRIEPSEMGTLDGMDVASSKLFKYQQKMGTSSPAPGVASTEEDEKEKSYQAKERHHRETALHRSRIVVLPFDRGNSASSQPGTTGLESHNGQSEGAINTASPSGQDSARLDQGQAGSQGQSHTPATAQRLAPSDKGYKRLLSFGRSVAWPFERRR